MKRLLIAICLLPLLCGIARAQTGNVYPGYGPITGGPGVSFVVVGAGFQLNVSGAAPTSLTFGATSVPLSGTPPTTGQCLGLTGGVVGGVSCGASFATQVNGPIVSGSAITEPTNTWFAQNYSGATMDVQLAACLSAASQGSNHGFCDARGITGNQTIAATVNVPSAVTLLLGNVKIAYTVAPAFTVASNSTILGVQNTGSGGTPVTEMDASGVTAPFTAIQCVNTDCKNPDVEKIIVRGMTSNTDGSIGINTNFWTYGRVIGMTFTGFQTGLQCGNNSPPGGTYYNKFEQNTGGGVMGTFEDYQQNCNANESSLDQVHSTSATFAWNLEAGSLTNTIIAADCEVLSVGDCFDISSGGGNTIIDPYMESSKGGIKFESTASFNYVVGSSHATSMGVDGAVSYLSGSHDNFVWLPGLGSGYEPLFPIFFGTQNLYINSGTEGKYFDILDDPLGSGIFDVEVAFTPGAAAETNDGLTGHGGLKAGNIRATGGFTWSGSSVGSIINSASTPVCTPVCEPSDTTNCASPATSFTYAVVGIDFNAIKTTRSSSVTCTNTAEANFITAAAQNTAGTGAGTPLGCNTGLHTGTCVGEGNLLTWAKSSGDGIQRWDIVGPDLTHSVALNQAVLIPGSQATPGTTYSYFDTATTNSPYTPPTRNGTNDLTIAGGMAIGAPTGGVVASGDVNAKTFHINNSNKGFPFASTTVSATPATATVGCTDTAVAVTSATTSMTCLATPQGNPGGSASFDWSCYVTAGNANVHLCELVSIGSPAAATYNVQVFN